MCCKRKKIFQVVWYVRWRGLCASTTKKRCFQHEVRLLKASLKDKEEKILLQVRWGGYKKLFLQWSKPGCAQDGATELGASPPAAEGFAELTLGKSWVYNGGWSQYRISIAFQYRIRNKHVQMWQLSLLERKIIQGFYVSTGFVGTRKPESFSEERASFPHSEVI